MSFELNVKQEGREINLKGQVPLGQQIEGEFEICGNDLLNLDLTCSQTPRATRPLLSRDLTWAPIAARKNVRALDLSVGPLPQRLNYDTCGSRKTDIKSEPVIKSEPAINSEPVVKTEVVASPEPLADNKTESEVPEEPLTIGDLLLMIHSNPINGLVHVTMDEQTFAAMNAVPVNPQRLPPRRGPPRDAAFAANLRLAEYYAAHEMEFDDHDLYAAMLI